MLLLLFLWLILFRFVAMHNVDLFDQLMKILFVRVQIPTQVWLAWMPNRCLTDPPVISLKDWSVLFFLFFLSRSLCLFSSGISRVRKDDMQQFQQRWAAELHGDLQRDHSCVSFCTQFVIVSHLFWPVIVTYPRFCHVQSSASTNSTWFVSVDAIRIPSVAVICDAML